MWLLRKYLSRSFCLWTPSRDNRELKEWSRLKESWSRFSRFGDIRWHWSMPLDNLLFSVSSNDHEEAYGEVIVAGRSVTSPFRFSRLGFSLSFLGDRSHSETLYAIFLDVTKRRNFRQMKLVCPMEVLRCLLATCIPFLPEHVYLTCLSLLFVSVTQGSGATGDCCSKCWNEKQKKEQATSPIEIKKSMDVVVEEPSPMEVEPMETEEAPVLAPKKQKKKKVSYKSMMAGVTQGATKDISQEKERLRQVTGGGAFSKIDKI
jgi:hypothetical protein